MPKKYAAPRATLAENLVELLKKTKMSSPELATKAKVDRKTVNNMLNARYDPRPEMVDAVAGVFGLTGWQLLRPGTGKSYMGPSDIDALLENFYTASPEDQAMILRIAEKSGGYKTTK